MFENYFTNGLFYNNVPLFIGSVTKQKHMQILEQYYGRFKDSTISWDMVRKMTGEMFSRDHGGVLGSKIGFYGNDGVCVFKYFVDSNDPQKVFSLVILFCNFVCFITISVCYVIVALITKKSRKATWNKDHNDITAAIRREKALQRKVSFIILTDFSCWVPFILMCLLHFFRYIDGSRFYEFCSIILLPINSSINPLIYNSEFENFRQRVIRNMLRLCSIIRPINIIGTTREVEPTTTN